MDFKTADLKYAEGVAAAMEERGVREGDIRAVLEYAEGGGDKLRSEDGRRCLARRRLGSFSACVEYSLEDGAALILDVYSHIVKLAADE